MLMLMFMVMLMMMFMVDLVIKLVRVSVFMTVRIHALFFLAIYAHRNIRSGNTAAGHPLRTYRNARHSDRVQFGENFFSFIFREQFQKRRSQHIARSSHSQIQ